MSMGISTNRCGGRGIRKIRGKKKEVKSIIYEHSTKHMAEDWKVGGTKYRATSGIVPVVCVSGSDC